MPAAPIAWSSWAERPRPRAPEKPQARRQVICAPPDAGYPLMEPEARIERGGSVSTKKVAGMRFGLPDSSLTEAPRPASGDSQTDEAGRA